MRTGSALRSREAVEGEPNHTALDTADGRLGRSVVIVGLIAGLAVANVLYGALPATPFDLMRPQTKRVIAAFVPEGWAFFTKSPRIPSPVAYRYDPQVGWRAVGTAAPTAPRYLMGLDRGGRAGGTELAMLMSGLDDTAWHGCAKDPLTCLSEIPVSSTIVNHSHRTVCGDVGLVLQDVLPWAWRNAPATMPSKIARVRVKC
jgi:antimicrobial peptide system SdpA family protein